MHLKMNKYDSLTTIYRLLMRKYVMKGGMSIGDLNSQIYLNYVKSINILSKEKRELENINETNKKKNKKEKKILFSTKKITQKNLIKIKVIYYLFAIIKKINGYKFKHKIIF